MLRAVHEPLRVRLRDRDGEDGRGDLFLRHFGVLVGGTQCCWADRDDGRPRQQQTGERALGSAVLDGRRARLFDGGEDGDLGARDDEAGHALRVTELDRDGNQVLGNEEVTRPCRLVSELGSQEHLACEDVADEGLPADTVKFSESAFRHRLPWHADQLCELPFGHGCSRGAGGQLLARDEHVDGLRAGQGLGLDLTDVAGDGEGPHECDAQGNSQEADSTLHVTCSYSIILVLVEPKPKLGPSMAPSVAGMSTRKPVRHLPWLLARHGGKAVVPRGKVLEADSFKR